MEQGWNNLVRENGLSFVWRTPVENLLFFTKWPSFKMSYFSRYVIASNWYWKFDVYFQNAGKI